MGVWKMTSFVRAFSRNEAAARSSSASRPDLLAHDPELVRLQPRQVEQVADEPVEPAHLLVHRGQRALQVVRADHALGERLDVAGDGGERRAQLVGDAHEEVALELVDLAQAVDHALEPRRELAQLVVGGALADHVHVEVAAGDLVGRAAEHAQRLRDAAGDVGGEDDRDDQADRDARGDEADHVLPRVVDVVQRLGQEHHADRLIAAARPAQPTR